MEKEAEKDEKRGGKRIPRPRGSNTKRNENRARCCLIANKSRRGYPHSNHCDNRVVHWKRRKSTIYMDTVPTKRETKEKTGGSA
ncbi:hypothetical protein HN011_007488 [Eciton burchellii]|nr:hypothetical protein HN011_007488 [Eciton burchellii]